MIAMTIATAGPGSSAPNFNPGGPSSVSNRHLGCTPGLPGSSLDALFRLRIPAPTVFQDPIPTPVTSSTVPARIGRQNSIGAGKPRTGFTSIGRSRLSGCAADINQVPVPLHQCQAGLAFTWESIQENRP